MDMDKGWADPCKTSEWPTGNPRHQRPRETKGGGSGVHWQSEQEDGGTLTRLIERKERVTDWLVMETTGPCVLP
jgi:hypothetical protein